MTIHPQTLKAVKTLVAYSRCFDIWALAGNSKASCRAHVMADLLGLDKIAQSKAGVTALRAEFYRQMGINGDCEANRENLFIAECQRQMGLLK